MVYGPEAVVMVLDRALGESVNRGAAPGRVIVVDFDRLLAAVVRPSGSGEDPDEDLVVGLIVLVSVDMRRRAVELSSSGGDGRC